MLASRLAAPSAAGSFRPLLAYLRLEVRRALRNRRYLVMTVVFPLVIYVLYTAVLPADGGDGTTIDGLTWPVVFLISMAAYGAIGAAMSQAVPVAMERRTGWTRQLRVTPLPGWAYVTAKAITAILLTVPSVALVVTVGSLVNHLGIGLGGALPIVVALALGAAPFAAIGLLIGYLLDAESAQGGMVLTLFTMAILGGLFVPLEAAPPVMATIGSMLPSSHLANLGRAAAAGTAPAALDIAVLVAWTVAAGALATWAYRRDERAGG